MSDKLRDEYISVVMSGTLLKFCKDNHLPFINADELALRPDLTDFQFGWLIAYITIWEKLID